MPQQHSTHDITQLAVDTDVQEVPFLGHNDELRTEESDDDLLEHVLAIET